MQKTVRLTGYSSFSVCICDCWYYREMVSSPLAKSVASVEQMSKCRDSLLRVSASATFHSDSIISFLCGMHYRQKPLFISLTFEFQRLAFTSFRHWGLSLHYCVTLYWPEGNKPKRQSGSWGDKQLCTLRSCSLSGSEPLAVIFFAVSCTLQPRKWMFPSVK